MPEFTALHLAMLASLLVVGIGLGWLLRSDRCAREKIAINAGWQEQVETRQAENDRLTDQNRGLMQQISEHQASGKDSAARAKELAASLKEALSERDELHRKLKDARARLDSATGERGSLEEERASLKEVLEGREAQLLADAAALKEKDNKIFRLSRQLSSWQSRVPPLVERFRQRDRDAQELQAELDRATNRIAELEAMARPGETRIQAVDEDALGRLDASNDQYGDRLEQDLAGLEDQVDAWYEAPLSSGTMFTNEPCADETAAAPPAPVPADGRDDLQQIKGVGPAIERTLNDLGIYRFDQIAEISEYDIDRVAARLRGFRSRIYREDWIGQARALREGPRADPD